MKKLIVLTIFLTASFLAYQGYADAEEIIHVCVNKAGIMRIVDDPEECHPGESYESLCKTCGTDISNQYWKSKKVSLAGGVFKETSLIAMRVTFYSMGGVLSPERSRIGL